LRAPLRSINGFSQVLLEDYADKLDEEGRYCLNRVRAASEHLARLIDDLLGLSCMTCSEIIHQRVDLSALVRGFVKELERSDPERAVEFVL
jgi:light-regulated signal transduction histidine kinase (bacteriophytochrome)